MTERAYYSRHRTSDAVRKLTVNLYYFVLGFSYKKRHRMSTDTLKLIIKCA